MSYNTLKIIDFLAGPNLNLTEFWQYYQSNSELGRIDLNSEILNLLAPLMGTEADRSALLTLAFGNDHSILRSLDFRGSADIFIGGMIGKLQSYGEIVPGKQALWALLETVRQGRGVDKQLRIEALKPKVYKELAGRTSREKANFLINELQPREDLCSLIFYLTNYWFDGARENPAILINTLHKNLFFAAQELWNLNNLWC